MAVFKAVTKEKLADIETPVSAYLKLCSHKPDSFLLESAEAHERVGRYSILAYDPLACLELWPDEALVWEDGAKKSHPAGDFFDLIRSLLQGLTCEPPPALPAVGSLMGFIGYDAVRLIERLGDPVRSNQPTARLVFPSRFIVFDHLKRVMSLVALGRDEVCCWDKIEEIEAGLDSYLRIDQPRPGLELSPPPEGRFREAVRKAKEYIRDGEIFQVVLADCFEGRTEVEPFHLYRLLRVKSPSAYMFFLDFGSLKLVGASPETLVKVQGKTVFLRPIAGTRPRSEIPEKDKALEMELRGSAKECAEHVMHLVSQVEGRLRADADAVDAFKAGFPAGTVSGAPKVRAMQIIDELEAAPRGVYSGAVGYFGPDNQMDTCIAIRMIVFQDGRFTIPVGAGIVADSEPAMEYQEIQQKAAQSIAVL
ncbi:MAG: anthranilate synthase component I family protein, partial [Deltaproteobacteria bacterium]|nr:anthranilate synthase component I family protein [Deltaproteobacteria bacterium]